MTTSVGNLKSLPMEVQYEVLTEIKERRKQNSWHKMSEMPSNAEGFSGFQMERLRKRKTAQKTLESVGKTIGDESSGLTKKAQLLCVLLYLGTNRS